MADRVINTYSMAVPAVCVDDGKVFKKCSEVYASDVLANLGSSP
jgi:hypothetical protein